MMQIYNDRSLCGVRIDHISNDLAGYTMPSAIRIYRYKDDGSAYVFFERPVVDISSADFSVLDIYTAPGETYHYEVRYLIDALEVAVCSVFVEADFNGIFIGNTVEQYVCVSNPTLTHQRQTSTTYVQPFFSKKPQAVRNGLLDFHTGTAQGIFTPFDEKKNPQYGRNQAYRKAFADFLTNAQVKVLKNYEGYIWMVQVDATLQETYQGTIDAQEFQFNWTEVADLPLEPKAVLLK